MPGPWMAAVLPDGEWRVFSGHMGNGIASISYSTHDEPAIANARLIAAAPELLEALEKLADIDFRLGPENGELENALRVIAKAKGLPEPQPPYLRSEILGEGGAK